MVQDGTPDAREISATDHPISSKALSPKPLTPAAQRALSEAEERRRGTAPDQDNAPGEIGGRDGPEPVRFGDWEVKGIAIDF